MKTIIDLVTSLINFVVALFSLTKPKRSTLKIQIMTEKMFTIAAIVVFGFLILAAICYVFKQKWVENYQP